MEEFPKIHPKELGMLNRPTHLSRFHPKFLSLDETLVGGVLVSLWWQCRLPSPPKRMRLALVDLIIDIGLLY